MKKPYSPEDLCRLLERLTADTAIKIKLSESHPAFGEELLEPVDVVVAVDDVLLAHQRAEQRQRRLDAVHHHLIERALSRISASVRVLPCTISLPTSES